MQYIWVPERAQSTLTAGQPANNIKMQVMRSCADTRSRRRNKFGYSSLSNHKLLSSASRLNTLARRQARIVVMHACECTQLNVTTRRAIQKRNVRLTHLDKQTHTHTCSNYAACRTSTRKTVYLICYSSAWSPFSVVTVNVSEALFATLWLSQTGRKTTELWLWLPLS